VEDARTVIGVLRPDACIEIASEATLLGRISRIRGPTEISLTLISLFTGLPFPLFFPLSIFVFAAALTTTPSLTIIL
jgi:hypothetical protein